MQKVKRAIGTVIIGRILTILLILLPCAAIAHKSVVSDSNLDKITEDKKPEHKCYIYYQRDATRHEISCHDYLHDSDIDGIDNEFLVDPGINVPVVPEEEIAPSLLPPYKTTPSTNGGSQIVYSGNGVHYQINTCGQFGSNIIIFKGSANISVNNNTLHYDGPVTIFNGNVLLK